MSTSYSYFCPCPRGMEDALAEELKEIAEKSKTLAIHQTIPGGVHCSGMIEDCWLINLYSRIASRVLLRIAQSSYKSEEDIYRLAVKQPWESWFDVQNTLRIDITAIKSPLKSLNFTTLRIKDGVVDRFRSQNGIRPSINTHAPDIRIAGFLDAHNVTLYLDTSGEALFKRGWRLETGDAPLRENLAAGLLRISGWKPGIPLLDPMCGSGTILIEAARMMMGIPPGYKRSFSFEKLSNFDAAKWKALKDAVKVNPVPDNPMIYGSDISGDMLTMTRHNLQEAGVPFDIPLHQIEAQEIKMPVDKPGIILTNPPYGERIGVRGNRNLEADELASQFYQALGTTLKQRFPNWSVFLFTADLSVPKMLRLKDDRNTPLYNGPSDCRLFRFEMVAGSNRPRQSRTFRSEDQK